MCKNWLKKAQKGDLVSMFELAGFYAPFLRSLKEDCEKVEGYVCAPNSELKAACLGAAATRGFAPAQYEYGMTYFFGDGVVVDKVNAHNWITLSAAQGYPLAYFTLGEIYQFGLGRPKDISKAIKSFEAAAFLGDFRAKERLKALRSE